MESIWEMGRLRLYQLKRDNLEWTQNKLANTLGRSLSWVKKRLRRFRATLETFNGQSRAPHSRPRQIVPMVQDAILELRDQLHDKYGRVVGPTTIRYHWHKDDYLQRQGPYLAKSTRTICKVLKEAGRMPTRVC